MRRFLMMKEEARTAAATPGSEKIDALCRAVESVIKGKSEAVRLAIVGVIAGGHLLLEDRPGVGKTTLAHALACALGGKFQRIQFTADLLPSDVTGISIYNERTGEFEFKRGPLFANVVLADEINRATPKTQSSLLEAMAESHVTVEGTTHKLPAPFVVLATQNPVEHHGTYPLPESQLDRFMLRLEMGYPSVEDEKQILRDRADGDPLERLQPVIDSEDVLELQREATTILVDDALVDYLMRIVDATRNSEMLDLGVSPRGTLALFRAAQALALTEGRAFCLPDDIKRLVSPVFAHRLMINSRFASPLTRNTEAESVLRDIVKNISVPV